MQLECNCRKLHRRICNWKNTRSGSPCENGSVPLQQNCSLMRALRIQCYKSVWVLNELNLFCCFLLADKWQVLFMRYETKTNTFKSYKRPTWQAIVLNYIKTYRQFASIFLCFSSCIFLCAVAFQLHSSCKFRLQILFTLGEAFAGAKTKQTDPN